MAQVPDAEVLTAAMRQELPGGPTHNIDGEPGSRLGALAPKSARLSCPYRASLASAARFAALPGGQRHAGPWHQEYHRIRGIGSIRYPAGRRCRRRRARRLRAGMNGENIVSTSAFLPLVRRGRRCWRERGQAATHGFPAITDGPPAPPGGGW